MARFWEILQIGFLSMFFAEVIAGSSGVWLVNPFSWLVTLPLYLVHTVFLFNVGKRLQFNKISQYYLLGTIFGLYEAWITKVLWSGYPALPGETRTAIVGIYFGIAIFEFSTLVFFYHPIFSFLLPLISFGVLQQMHRGSKVIYLSMDFEKSRKSGFIILLCFIFAASIFVFNYQFNIVNMLLTALGTILLIYLVDLRIRSKPDAYADDQLLVGKRGMILMILFLAVLYVATFFYLVPGIFPELIGYFAIILFYIIPMVVLSRRSNSSTDHVELIDKSSLKRIGIVFLLMIVVFVVLGPITAFIVLFSQLISFVMGPIFYVLMINSALKHKESQTQD